MFLPLAYTDVTLRGGSLPLALAQRFGGWIRLVALPPTRKGSKEGLYCGIRCFGLSHLRL